MTIGEQIRTARQAKKIRQHVIADELGVTIQAVSQWERDKTVPSQLNLMRLANLLDIKIDGLEVIKQMPLFAKPANYAPLIGQFPTIFYGKAGEELLRQDEMADFPDHDLPTTEMIPFNWQAVGNVFAMKVEDRSMAPDFLPGDIIIADAGITAEPGDYIIGQCFPLKGGLFRRLRIRGVDEDGKDIADFVPLNSDYPTDTVTLGKTGEVTGCVREFRRILREK